MKEESRVEWSELLESGLSQMSSVPPSSDDQLWPLQYLCTLATTSENQVSHNNMNIQPLLTKENQQCKVSALSLHV